MDLSDKEQELYDFIKNSTKENGVTVKEMQSALGEQVVGCLGKILKNEEVERTKFKPTDDYNTKAVWHYKIKEK